MKAKKILMPIFAIGMAISIVGCGQTEDNTNDISNNFVPVEERILEGVSIDFEDGKSEFATEAASMKGGDPSEIVVTKVNESNVLTTVNTAGELSVFIGIDLNALLGEKITEVSTIQFTAGVLGDEFHAVSGRVYTYTGNDLNETKIGDYSVYLETANPKIINFDVTNPFIAGADNFIIISKESDSNDVPTEIYIDDIGFFDKDGNVIEVDTNAVVSDSSPLAVKIEAGVDVFHFDGNYTGDWTLSGLIPAEYFQDVTENKKIIVDIEFPEEREYYCIAAVSSYWTKIKPEEFIGLTAYEEEEDPPEGTLYHLKTDGVFSVDDITNKTMEFVLTPKACEVFASEGGMAFMVYGISPVTVILADEDYER